MVYTCGPTPMLKAVKDKYKGKKVFISLEERMGCGIGGALPVCAVPLEMDTGRYVSMVRYFVRRRSYYE